MKIDLGSCQYDSIGEMLSVAIEKDLDVEEFANSLGYDLEFDDIRVELDSYEECKNPAEFFLKFRRDCADDLWSAAYLVAMDCLEFDLNPSCEDAADDNKEAAIHCYLLLKKGGVTSVDFFAGFAT